MNDSIIVKMSEDMRSPKVTLPSPPVEVFYDKRRMAVTLEFTSLNEIEMLRDKLSAFIAFHRGLETKEPARHGDLPRRLPTQYHGVPFTVEDDVG